MRTMNPNTAAGIDAQVTGATDLIELSFAANPIRLTTAGRDISWNGQTWSAGFADVVGIRETTDQQAQGCTLELTGVNQELIASFLNNSSVGRRCKIYRAQLDANYAVTDVLLLLDGYMNGDWEATDSREAEARQDSGTCTVSTQIMSRAAMREQVRGVRTEILSHQKHFPGDPSFTMVPSLSVWGVEWPRRGEQ